MGKVIMSGIVPQLTKPSAGILASDLAVGSTVKLMENGSAVEYLVVNQGIPGNSSLYDSSCNGVWLLRKNLHSERVWNASGNLSTYANSDINTWLNGEFFNSLGSVEQAAIKQAKIPYCLGGGSTTINSGANGLPVKAFLLGGYEVGWTTATASYFPIDGACLSYFNGTSATDTKRIANLNGSAGPWWIRSPNTSRSNVVRCVLVSGGYNMGYSPKSSYGIRPAVIIPFDATFDPGTMLLTGRPSGNNSITVAVSDSAGYLNVIIGTSGVLTVGGHTITAANTELSGMNATIEITYRLTASLSKARTMKVNGTAIGTAGTAGDTLTTTIAVQNGDTITIEFTS